MKPIDLQYSYKKVIGFTIQQKNTLLKLEKNNININQFIRQAIKEKIEREWPNIKEKSKRIKNAPDWFINIEYGLQFRKSNRGIFIRRTS